jgi:menaquinone-specific isochorismate synthase
MFKRISEIELPPDRIKKTFINYLKSYSTNYGEFPTVLQLAAPVLISDPLAWLKNQRFNEKNYWYDKKADLEIAGIGVADLVNGELISDYSAVIQDIQKYSSFTCNKCRYFGGFSFYKNVLINDEWQTFGAYRFVLPLFEITKDGGTVLFKCNLIHPDQEVIERLIQSLEKVTFQESALISEIPAIINIISRPEKAEWQKIINSALYHIHSADYEKIVLARKIEVEMESPPDVFTVLSVLRNTNHHTVSFLFQTEENTAFIGTTPELLYRREGRNLISEAVAGTRPRGKNKIDDDKLVNELLTSEKELREHKYVMRSLQTNLSHLCEKVELTGAVSVLKLSQLQHLYMPFNGLLRPDTTDGDILEAMHPTPAVGGYPEKSVLPILQETEPFNRGWYAAPVGWTAVDSATFAVAIRSALIIKNRFFLYSGAGIVDGSCPEKEWEELDNKIYHYKKVLKFDSKSLEKHQQLLGLLTH